MRQAPNTSVGGSRQQKKLYHDKPGFASQRQNIIE